MGNGPFAACLPQHALTGVLLTRDEDPVPEPQQYTAHDLLDPAKYPTLKPEQVALILGVSRSTIYEYLRQGTIQVIRLSPRKALIPTAALAAMLAGQVTR